MRMPNVAQAAHSTDKVATAIRRRNSALHHCLTLDDGIGRLGAWFLLEFEAVMQGSEHSVPSWRGTVARFGLADLGL
jgi:hypothetical protein